MPNSHLVRGSQELFRSDFHSSDTVALQGITLVGSPTIDEGLVLNGSTQYGIIDKSFEVGSYWVKIVFTPNFDPTDSVQYYFASYGPYKNDDGFCHIKNGADETLYVVSGTSWAYYLPAEYEAHWNSLAENVLIARCTIGSAPSLFLNGTLLTPTTVLGSCTSRVAPNLTIGAANGYLDHFNGTIHQFIVGQNALTDEDAQKLYDGSLGEELNSKNSLVSLPCRTLYEIGNGIELVTDGDMELDGIANWTEGFFGDGLVSKVPSWADGNLQAIRIERNTTNHFWTTQTLPLVVDGAKCRVKAKFYSSDVVASGVEIWLGWSSLGINTVVDGEEEVEFTLTASNNTDLWIGGVSTTPGAYIDFEFVSVELVETVTDPVGILSETGTTKVLAGSDGVTAAEFPSLLSPKGFEFDGTANFLTIPDNTALSFGDGAGNDSPFSIEALIRPEATSFSILGKNSADAVGEYWMGSTPTWMYVFLIDASGNYLARYTKTYTPAVEIGKYAHWLATYNGMKAASGLKLYRNGIRVDTDTLGSGYLGMTPSDEPVRIGKVGPRYANGKIFTSVIWPFELSSLQARRLSAKAFAELNI